MTAVILPHTSASILLGFTTTTSCGVNLDAATPMVIMSTPIGSCGAGKILTHFKTFLYLDLYLSIHVDRCSDPSCNAYIEGTKRVQLAAYSYDNGVAPFENPKDLMKEFATTIETDKKYMLIMAMDETGLSTFTLADASGNPLETQTVQHTVTCPDNYFEGTVQGWYFGGTCRAPEDVLVTYSSGV